AVERLEAIERNRDAFQVENRPVGDVDAFGGKAPDDRMGALACPAAGLVQRPADDRRGAHLPASAASPASPAGAGAPPGAASRRVLSAPLVPAAVGAIDTASSSSPRAVRRRPAR